MKKSKYFLAKSGLRPKKSLGQHFLEDHGIIDKIITLIQLNKNDVVVEIGPGTGALTIPVLPYVCHLIAIEKDRLLINLLRKKLSAEEGKKITLISGDALKIDFKKISDDFKQKIRIIGNIPYNISSPLLERLILYRAYIKSATLMFQHEFALRLIAPPGQRKCSALTIISQYYAEISPVIKIKRDAFFPIPKVDSMVLKMDFERPYKFQAKDEMIFRKIVKSSFLFRRKTILNSLEKATVSLSREEIAQALEQCNIDPKKRAETLSIYDFIRLSLVLPANRQNLDTQ
jgi:16S rRNA (adenine1518-N6/adenine1519-N6)-dimethyltransferase